ncbi:MAG: ArnT family glycosyltransferase [Candidatus Eiseniibacteriota bacterium]
MRFAAPLLAVLCALVLFTALDRPGFIDDREARDARVARDCVRHREVLTPQAGGDPVYEKPMLAYAPEVVAFSLSRSPATRNTPMRSRQARGLGALALVLLTGSIASRRFGIRAGWCSTIALVTMLGVPLAARTDGTQVFATLLGWCAAGILSGAVLRPEASRDAALALAYAALAGTALVGGPLAALWPCGGIALYAALTRDRAAWHRTRPLTGLAIVLGLALPWYGTQVFLHGGSWLTRAVWFPYGLDAHAAWFSGPLIALSVLVLASFPWSVLMPEATRHAAAQPDAHAAHLQIAFLACALLPVILHPGVPLSAALPALPAAAMLCGRFTDHVLENPESLHGAVARAARTLALLGSGGALLLAIASSRVPDAASDVRLLAAATFLTSWLPLLAVWRGRHAIAVALIALPVALGAPLTSAILLPRLEHYLNARDVAAAMNNRSPESAPLAVFAPAPPSLNYYTHRNIVRIEPEAAALQRLCAEDGQAYAAFSPALESDVARRLGAPLEILWRGPTMMLARANLAHAEISRPDSSVSPPPAIVPRERAR